MVVRLRLASRFEAFYRVKTKYRVVGVVLCSAGLSAPVGSQTPSGSRPLAVSPASPGIVCMGSSSASTDL